MDELQLVQILVPKPKAGETWGLGASSEARLCAWMHEHLELAIELCEGADARETELVDHFAPPLNLTKSMQTGQHQRISDARAHVRASLYVGGISPTQATFELAVSTPEDQTAIQRPATMNSPLIARSGQPVGTENDTAEAIAARHHLNSKSYRQRLRDTVSQYRKPQNWEFPVGSPEHMDMIKVAARMAR